MMTATTASTRRISTFFVKINAAALTTPNDNAAPATHTATARAVLR
jgi:hypothetical protein